MASKCSTIFGDIGETLLCRIDIVPNGEFRRLAIELAQRIAPVRLPLRKLTHDVLEVLFERFDGRLDLPALGFRPGAKFVRRNRLTLAHRSERKAHRGAQDTNVFGGGLVAHGREGFGLFGLESLIDGAAPRLVILAFEHRGQRGFQIVDQPAHHVAEFIGASRRQFDGHRFARILKVVDVDPVGWPAALAGGFGKNPLDGALHAHAAWPDDEKVEPGRADAGSERDGIERALLPDKPVRRLNVGGRFE